MRPIRLPRALALMSATVVLALARVNAQQITPLPCPPEQAKAFDFLVGEWHGVVYDLKGQDSTAGATAQVSTAKVLNGCALVEHWHFEENGAPEVDGVVVRASDQASGKWSYDRATNRNEHLTYDGQLVNGVWRVAYTLTAQGAPVGIHITWVPTPPGYSELISRSTDGGTTWTATRHVHFSRARTAH